MTATSPSSFAGLACRLPLPPPQPARAPPREPRGDRAGARSPLYGSGLPVRHHDDAVGDRADEREVVLDEDERDPLRADLAEDLGEPRAFSGARRPGRRLVEEQQPRPRRKRGREHQQALLEAVQQLRRPPRRAPRARTERSVSSAAARRALASARAFGVAASARTGPLDRACSPAPTRAFSSAVSVENVAVCWSVRTTPTRRAPPGRLPRAACRRARSRRRRAAARPRARGAPSSSRSRSHRRARPSRPVPTSRSNPARAWTPPYDFRRPARGEDCGSRRAPRHGRGGGRGGRCLPGR